jgi:hypothetical protein
MPDRLYPPNIKLNNEDVNAIDIIAVAYSFFMSAFILPVHKKILILLFYIISNFHISITY